MGAMKWISYSERKPKKDGIYVVLVNRPAGYSDPYNNDTGRSRKLFTHEIPSKTEVIWALWKYKEVCKDITVDSVIYEKVYYFWNSHDDPISDVLFWCDLPKIPEHLVTR